MSSYVNTPTLDFTEKPIYKSWLRRIKVTLYSPKEKKAIVFGGNGSKDYNIKIKGEKHLSLAQDKGVVSIDNIQYDTIIKLMIGEYNLITIEVAYGNAPYEIYFKGALAYITQKVHSKHDTTTYFNYANELIASKTLLRTNFTLNSSINMYAALNYICKSSGINNPQLSNDLKEYTLSTVMANSNDKSIAKGISQVLEQDNGKWIVNADSSLGQTVSVTTLKGKRYIVVNPNSMIIAGGNPTISNEGLKIKLLPVFNFIPGDIIHIDNAILDGSDSNSDITSSFNFNYIDENGDYMIQQIDYSFTNRGTSFELEIKGRALKYFDALIGD